MNIKVAPDTDKGLKNEEIVSVNCSRSHDDRCLRPHQRYWEKVA